MAIATEATKASEAKPAGPKPRLSDEDRRLQAKERRERFAELVPQIGPALDAMTPEDRAALRTSKKTPAVVREMLTLIPEPPRDALQLAEFSNSAYRCVLDSKIDPRLLDDDERFWSAFCGLLKPFDDVRTVSADRSSCADFIVTDATEKYCNARLTSYLRIPVRVGPQPDWLPEGYGLKRCEPSPSNPVDGWVVLRESDGFEMMESGKPFKDVESARRWLLDHAIFRKEESPRYQPR